MTDQRNHFTKVSGGTDEFMGFLGGVWESQRKGSYITKKSTPSMGDPKTEHLELPVQLAGSSIEESSLHHDFLPLL